MPIQTSETSPFDVWADAGIDESMLDQLKDEDDDSDATDEEDSTDATDAKSEGTDGAEAKPDDDADVTRLVEERVNQMLEKALSGDADTPLYKGMQRHLAQRERLINEQQTVVEQVVSKNKELEDTLSQMTQSMEILTKLTLSNLPPDEQATAVTEFQNAYIESLKRQNQSLKDGGKSQQQAQSQTAPEGEVDFNALVQEHLTKFKNGRRNRAEKAGLDPDDETLDYGKDDEPMADRLEKFEESLERALEAKRQKSIEDVSQKTDVIPTRNGAGGTVKQAAIGGKSTLQRGAEARLAELRKLAGI